MGKGEYLVRSAASGPLGGAVFEWIIVGAMLGGAGAGAAVTLTRRRRRRADALAIAGAVARQKAFEHAEVIVHEVERLSLAETQYAGGVDADSPYEFRAELTVRPAGELDWNPLELALVAEPVATGYLDLGPVVRLTSVEVLRAPDGAPASRGPQRLRLTFRTQSPSSTVKLEYGGAVFGCIGTMGVAVVSQRPIPASLRAPAVALAVPAPSRPSGPSLASLAHASAPKEHVVDGLWDAPSAVPASKVSPSPTFGPSKFAAPPGPERPTALSALDDLLFRPELQGIVPAGTAMLGGSSAAPRKARPNRPHRPPSPRYRPPCTVPGSCSISTAGQANTSTCHRLPGSMKPRGVRSRRGGGPPAIPYLAGSSTLTRSFGTPPSRPARSRRHCCEPPTMFIA